MLICIFITQNLELDSNLGCINCNVVQHPSQNISNHIKNINTSAISTSFASRTRSPVSEVTDLPCLRCNKQRRIRVRVRTSETTCKTSWTLRDVYGFFCKDCRHHTFVYLCTIFRSIPFLLVLAGF